MGNILRGAALAAALLFLAPAAARADDGAVKRGEYLFHAAGCESCHTDRKNNGPRLAGGAPIKTEFGTFYGPNITPDPAHGIGKWTDAQFERALRHGRDEDGDFLFPVFPYTSFTYMTEADAKDIRAYLATVPPSAMESKPQDVSFPFSIRVLQLFWRWLNFVPGPYVADKTQSEEWNRGAYLVTALVHCGECHTPRNLTGGLQRDMWMAGNAHGPDGAHIPNITPDPETGIGKWSVDDIVQYLSTGLDPDGDVAGSLMADVVEVSTSKLTDADRHAIAVYIKALKPIRRAPTARHAD
jgi:mono/diheme cytochrome c family protein